VRVNSEDPHRWLPAAPGETSRHLFLLSHAKGLVCCRLRQADRTHFTLTSSEAAYAEITLEMTREFRLLGVVDFEIRRLDREKPPVVPKDLARFWRPSPLLSTDQILHGSALLRTSRHRAGLSFREASSRSRKIADELRDAHFAIAASTLAGYEDSDDPPRHVQKILSLLTLYAVPFQAFLEALGLPLAETGKEAIPDAWLAPEALERSNETFDGLRPGGILERLVRELEELPYFLLHSLDQLSGIAGLSLRDVFWVGANRRSYHPLLRQALFVVIHRRLKRPGPPASGPPWRQHLYLLLTRDHGYLLGRCHREGETLVVHPFSDGLVSAERFRNRIDAEVVGRVVAIVRRVLPRI